MNRSKNKAASSVDVARRAGVSQSTVAIVMRGEAKRRKISSETTQRVLKAAADLAYVPNGIARNLRLRRSGSIGLVLIDLRLEWARGILEGMNNVFDETEHTAFISVHENVPWRARKELRACVERRDEGIICQPVPAEAEIYAYFQRTGVPVVLLGDCPEDVRDLSFVAWDAGPAAHMAMEYLIATGRRRIGVVSVDYPMRMHRVREKTALTVLREAGMPASGRGFVSLPVGSSGPQVLTDALRRMFAPGGEHPGALFAINDALALATLEELHALGVRVPDDVALMGMGDLPVTAYSGISLSTMKEPVEEMGREAAKLMLELIADPGKAPVERLIPCVELKARRTTITS
ncbi:MAG TPA: LacI family DNA-binding transcriptional regulator [Candidatus Hydrogenedentes bacterium]|nr:LacI family DNA-binding transcriptional regulator [Candidatus Hydrogenedentota bacterium]